MLWRKLFLYTANDRDHILLSCNIPLNDFDRIFREWFLSHYSDDEKLLMLDNDLENIYMILINFGM